MFGYMYVFNIFPVTEKQVDRHCKKYKISRYD